MDKKLYRLNELSDLLSIGKSTIWAWVKEGEFPEPIQISPRMTCWNASDIEGWINTKTQKEVK